MSVNQVVRIIPTLKVNNRRLNEEFYIQTLGMKPLLEESAFLSLGDQSGVEKLVLEESPSMRTRRVEGMKKLARLIVKVEDPSEIEALLGRMDQTPNLYQGEKGYAFEVFSPEGDLVLVHAEDCLDSLHPVEGEVGFTANDQFEHISQFEISMSVHLPASIRSLLDESELENYLSFEQGQGEDLLVDNSVTWDLSMLKLQVDHFDLEDLRQRFVEKESFIPKSEKFFVSKDSNNIELWFEQV